MLKQPKITIIIVVYNAFESIERSILSVICQDYSNLQFIIIDGGSTDGTTDIIERYLDKIDNYISEPDKGVYDAMNKALPLIEGDWFYFLGAGDMLLNMLDKVAKTLIDKTRIYYGNVYRKDTLKVYDGKFSSFKLAVNNVCHQAIFYPKSIAGKYSYNTQYKIQADHDFNMRCHGDKNYRLKYIPLIICLYEGDGYSAKNIDLPFFADKINIIKSNFSMQVYFYALIRRKIARLIKKITNNK
jgi:glycosyltransferase involved in cell wall biosynthesis